MTLCDARPGQSVSVLGLSARGAERRRLLDLGFVPGTKINVIRKSPLGDPVAYRVRGVTVALRLADARQIAIESEDI